MHSIRKNKISKMMRYKFILKLNYYFELHLEILNLELFKMNRLQTNLFAAHWLRPQMYGCDLEEHKQSFVCCFVSLFVVLNEVIIGICCIILLQYLLFTHMSLRFISKIWHFFMFCTNLLPDSILFSNSRSMPSL